MKAVISVPDQTFDRAEKAAKKHGLTRSQFYSAAAERYAAELEAQDLTDAINAAVDAANADKSTGLAAAAGRRLFAADEYQW